MTKFVKVVRNEGVLRSATTFNEDYSLEYKPNEWTKPVEGTGGVFIFENIEAARSYFGNGDGIYEYWYCKANNPRPLHLMCSYYLSAYFRDFWQGKYVANFDLNDIPPDGTFIADEIMITERVDLDLL